MDNDSEKSAAVGTTQPQADAPNAQPILTKEPLAETPQDDDTPWSIWSPKQRKLIILTASFASLLSPLSSQIYLPSLDTIANDLDVTNSEVNLSITTFLILQAIAPTFTAQLSDTMGRRPLYMACFVLYMAANLGLALQNNYAALLVLRCFQSAGSSGTAALSNAVATDITTSAERGSYIVYAAAIPMLGPTLVSYFVAYRCSKLTNAIGSYNWWFTCSVSRMAFRFLVSLRADGCGGHTHGHHIP